MNYDSDPICLSDQVRVGARQIIKEVIDCLPENAKLYLVGGAIRNTKYYLSHHQTLPQRDYDLIFVDIEQDEFIKKLLAKDFKHGEIQKATQKVFLKSGTPNPQTISDYVVLDISFYKYGKISDLLRQKANFSVNGFAIELTNLFDKNWHDKVIALPNAEKDIAIKQLRLNPDQSPEYLYSNLFAAIRFVSQGFKPPEEEKIRAMLKFHKQYPKEKFNKNCEKVFNYVGGEANARKIVKNLGIYEDIFNIKFLDSIQM